MTIALVIAVTIGLSLAMSVAWLVQRRTGNAGWVDAVWTFALGAAGVIYALSPSAVIPWPSTRQVLVAVLVAAWSLRLGLYLLRRTGRLPEDARYAQFRREWGETYQSRMFMFLQIQALAAAFLALSMLLAARNPHPFGILDVIALAVLGSAIIGAGIADAQLGRFRAEQANRSRICDSGLWSLSRHPNYFFEWLGWMAYPIFAIDPSGSYLWGWLAFSGPVAMYGLLVHVSGIPPTEAHMLRTRGDAFRRYQERTRPFLPLPKAGT